MQRGCGCGCGCGVVWCARSHLLILMLCKRSGESSESAPSIEEHPGPPARTHARTRANQGGRTGTKHAVSARGAAPPAKPTLAPRCPPHCWPVRAHDFVSSGARGGWGMGGWVLAAPLPGRHPQVAGGHGPRQPSPARPHTVGPQDDRRVGNVLLLGAKVPVEQELLRAAAAAAVWLPCVARGHGEEHEASISIGCVAEECALRACVRARARRW